MKIKSVTTGIATLGLTAALTLLGSVNPALAATVDAGVADCSGVADEERTVTVVAGDSITFSTTTCSQAYWDELTGTNPYNGGVMEQIATALPINWTATIPGDAYSCDDVFEFADDATGGTTLFNGRFSYWTITCVAATPDTLPNTGVNLGVIGLSAAGLLTAGGIALMIRRRAAQG